MVTRKRTTLVAIGNGLFARTRTTESWMDAYRRKQATCPHSKRDPRGMCYDCGNVERKDA